MKTDELGRPVSGEGYADAAFDLTGLELIGSTFVRCILTIHDNPASHTTLVGCRIADCYLVGDWPAVMYESEAVPEWAARTTSGSA